jgi:hypothetical protein
VKVTGVNLLCVNPARNTPRLTPVTHPNGGSFRPSYTTPWDSNPQSQRDERGRSEVGRRDPGMAISLDQLPKDFRPQLRVAVLDYSVLDERIPNGETQREVVVETEFGGDPTPLR